jgi:hypothetical protein
MITQKIGVVTIVKDDELIGIIYNNIKTRSKVLYKCVPMTEDEIIEIIGADEVDTWNMPVTTEQ